MASITITGIPELMSKLGNVGAIATLRPPMQRGVFRLLAGMAKAPPPIPAGLWAATTTPKQKRYFFAALKRGKVSTSRTGSARKWTTNVSESASGIVGVIGNNANHAPWVWSSSFQAKMHKDRWPTDQGVMDKEQGAIVADFENAIQGALNG
jgi:hypothetical protein